MFSGVKRFNGVNADIVEKTIQPEMHYARRKTEVPIYKVVFGI
jgi:hypothetical protein